MENTQPEKDAAQNADQPVNPEPEKAAKKPEAKPKTEATKPVAKPAAPVKKAEKAPATPARRFLLSSSPHIRSEESVARIMWTVTLTLVPATVAATYFFGFRALVLVMLGMVAAMATEYVLQKIFKAPSTWADGSAALTGVLVSFNIPAGVPWWIPVLGSVFAIGIAKLPFGGLGYNPMNPALLGRAFLLASWPVHMTKDWLDALWWTDSRFNFFSWNVNPADAFTYATPLEARKSLLQLIADSEGLNPTAETQLQAMSDILKDLVIGRVGGCIGETSALLLLLGAAYLLYKGYIDWRTPISFIGVVAIGGWMFGGSAGIFTGDFLFHIFAGGLILGAFYMATDMVTTPITPKGRLLFGVGCGLITLMIRLIGGYPEGVSYAILLMNLTTPLIDRYTKPRRFGHVKQATKG